MTEKKPLVIILLGPPGAGKGSQATLIRETLSPKKRLGHISTGELLRENIKRGTPLGLKAKKYIDEGQLVPDDLIFDMLFDRVKEPDCQEGYILDGFPRTLNQAEEFNKKLGSKSQLIALNLVISDDEVLKRLTKRLTCERCQRVYHLLFSPPKKAGICDVCGGKLYQRSDDSTEIVQKRLEVYHKQTKPLIEFYEKLNLLHSIDAALSKEKVLTQLLNALNSEE